MKTSFNILILSTLVLGSCSPTYKAGVSAYDDLYYTPRDARIQSETPVSQVRTQAQAPAVKEELSDYERYILEMEREGLNSEEGSLKAGPVAEDTLYYDETQEGAYDYYNDGSAPVVNNYYGSVYQSPSYTSRINRFHSPYYGYSYYDPWYDPYYSYSPWSFNLGFGYGLGWGHSSFGYGYPYYSPYYSYWDYPYYGYGYGYGGSYWRGYRNGYNDAYYWGGGGYYPYYYGSGHTDYGRSYTYGHRQSRSGYSTYGVNTTNPKSERTTSGTRTNTRETGIANNSTSGASRTRNTVITSAGSNAERNRMSAGNERQTSGSLDKNGNTAVRKTSVTTTRTGDRSPVSRYNNANRQSYTPTYTRPRTTTRPSYNTDNRSAGYRSSTSNQSGTYKSSTPARSGSSSSSSSYRSSTPTRSSSSSSSYRSSTPTRSSSSSSSYRSSTPTRSSSSSSSYRSSTPTRSGSSSSYRSSTPTRSGSSSSSSSGSSGRSSSGGSSRSSGSRR